MQTKNDTYWYTLAQQIKQWGRELGFQHVGITDTDLSIAKTQLSTWLELGYHGEMSYMERHAELRTHPELLVPDTIRVIMVRMNYLPPNAAIKHTLRDKNKAYISRYAVGGDYHKLIRKRLAKLADKIIAEVGPHSIRAFADSAPVMEKPLAVKAGLGWQGKNTLVLNQEAGSWFFLGALYTSLPLPIDSDVVKDECGTCSACMKICPTQAIIAPYVLDARRCISYLTIELRTSIPEEFRPLISNRVYGCDDCQLACPWNRFAKITDEKQFHPRHDLDSSSIIELFNWTEAEFDKNTEGSPIRRIGYECWLRNMAVGLGNAPYSDEIVAALNARKEYGSELVQEHVLWALQEQTRRGMLRVGSS
ncbi:MAG: tRNA epoxyqueuosine(34) reductase QueG [Gammaproteobacteria bacterium]|nr:tRNA epoxyqueuosine(34) reductase QueG [Gammaproteobacteria bacterium]